MESIFQKIATELNVKTNQVNVAVTLLDEGATVPFIARYRKEATGSLDDTQLRKLEERLYYLREMEERRTTILKSISEQEKLTPALEAAIKNAETKTVLEDLYLPYKPKRRTKGQIAIEAGLEPLADELSANPEQVPEKIAEGYVDAEKGLPDIRSVLEGAKYILMERFSELAELVGSIRDFLWQEARLSSRIVKGKEKEAKKFHDYFQYDEPLKKVPSHRALAILRGRKEGFLQLSLTLLNGDDKNTAHPCEAMIAEAWGIVNKNRPADAWLSEVVRWTWRIKLLPHMETDLIGRIKESAEQEAINVFSINLKDLLMSAPAGPRVTMGLDPGLRTGVKVAVIDGTGQLVDHTTIYPHAPQNRTAEAQGQLAKLILKHGVDLIAIGNGTASRETDRFVIELIKQFSQLAISKAVVSEAGASVYSASELAAREFPELDVVFRGAVSIARRLQDPLAELVKIEPKSIGVGQYQHDVSQTHLARSLDAIVEDCVNAVGVDINTASSALLRHVAGLNSSLADNIVAYRNKNGAFDQRSQLLEVGRLGNKAFEQSAGFLRIMNGSNPLDSSAVHPEAYPVVEQIATRNSKNIKSIIGDQPFLAGIQAENFTDEQFGLPTVNDIIKELQKPGRDPRPEFKTASFKEGIETIRDLAPDMMLEGVITNVTNFGAFVDIGVHQDGLVHISQLSSSFVKDPRTVVKTGDIVKVKVLEVDIDRCRITLSMRKDQSNAVSGRKTTGEQQSKAGGETQQHYSKRNSAGKHRTDSKHNQRQKPDKPVKQGSFAELFVNAKKIRK